MKSKAQLLLILFFCGVFQFTAGQESLSATQEADLKMKVKQIAEGTQTLTTDFDQIKQVSMLKEDIKATGSLTFKSPGNMKWEYTSPTSSTTVFKDGKLYITDRESKEVIDLNSNKLYRSFNELILKSMKGELFDDSSFNIYYYNTSAGYMAQFIPKDKRLQKFIASFEVYFNQKAEVNRIKLIESNEDFTSISFKNRQQNIPISDSDFNK